MSESCSVVELAPPAINSEHLGPCGLIAPEQSTPTETPISTRNYLSLNLMAAPGLLYVDGLNISRYFFPQKDLTMHLSP